MNPESLCNNKRRQENYSSGFAPLGVFIVIALFVTAGIGGYIFMSGKKPALPSLENMLPLKNPDTNLQGIWIYEKQYLARADTDFIEVPSAQNHAAYTEFKGTMACAEGTLDVQGQPILCKAYYPFLVAGQTLTITNNRPDQPNIQGEWSIKDDVLEVVIKLNTNPPGQKIKLVFKKYIGPLAPAVNESSPTKKVSLSSPATTPPATINKTPSPSSVHKIPPAPKQTIAKPAPFCGDNVCNGDETNYACIQDCRSMINIEINEDSLMPPPVGTYWARSYDSSSSEYDLPSPFQRMELLDGREVRFSLFNRSESKISEHDIVSEMLLVYPKERRTQVLDQTALLAGPSDTTEELPNPAIGSASKAFKFSSPDGKVRYVIVTITKGYHLVFTVNSGFFEYKALLDLVKKALERVEVYSSQR